VNSYRCMCDNVQHFLERAMTMTSVDGAKSVNKPRLILNAPELYATKRVTRFFRNQVIKAGAWIYGTA